MSIQHIFLTRFIGLLLLLIPASGQSQQKELSGEISVSGAFALYPMVVKWAEEFRKIHPKVRIDISGGGAGKGMTDVLAKVTDLGMVSREIYEAEIRKGVFAIPVVKDAVVPTINSNNPVITDIRKYGLKKEVARRLWDNQLKTWGEVLSIESRIPLHVYTRSDACGAAETWAAWFGMKQEDLGGTGVYGDPGIASAIQRDKVGIGMNNIAYVYDQKSKRPYEGIEVIPLDLNNNGLIDPEERFYDTIDRLMLAISEGIYPSPPTRDLYLVSNGQPQQEVIRAFLKYILTEGQKYVQEVGYVALSSSTVNTQLQWIEATDNY